MKGFKSGMKSLKINLSVSVVLMLTALCFITMVIQGNVLPLTFSRNVIIYGCTFIILIVWLILILLHSLGKVKLTEEKAVFAIIFSAMLLHCCYVILSGLYERQHDEGVYTGIASSQINPGHIGYIEYIYKFHKLPDMNPYQLFSYYHPPLHYAISAIWLIVLTSLGMPEDLAFENLQILPLFYSGLSMLITYLIIKKIGSKGRGLYVGLLLAAFHPALTIMSGSINNDMLSTLLLACCILSTLCFIREKSLKNLILIALSIAFGMLCKINTAVIALPVGLIFLLDFISVVRTGEKKAIISNIKNYILFGIISAIIGLSWIVRNFILFHEKPGIASSTETSVMYTGDYGLWARLGIPSFADWHFEFPFHPLSGDVIHNIWIIMFQTSLFAEEYPETLTGSPLFLCRIAYVIAIITAVCSMIIFLFTQYKKYRESVWESKLESVFLITGYMTFVSAFAAFSLKYPYTCSSDFRYIVICLVFIAVGLSDSTKEAAHNKLFGILSKIVRVTVCVTMMLTTIIYITWNQW